MTNDARRPIWLDVTLLLSACSAVVVLIALGNWQIDRLAWKRALIETVEARSNLTPIPLPTDPLKPEDHAYLPIIVNGDLRHDLTKRVKAVTELGPGYWIMTPLETDTQFVWINRGFAPNGAEIQEPSGKVDVVGLMRTTEPNGTFLERNNADTDRWVSRDVSALSQAAGLSDTAVFFIDAHHTGRLEDWPRGGLTKLHFRNSHLSYALTWYAMAILLIIGISVAVLDRRKSRRAEL